MHSNPVALVTGANKGIGLQIAKELSAKGLTVLVAARNLELGKAAAESIGAGAQAIQLDVTDQASIAAAAEYIRTTLGRLDVLVNNAAISHAGPPGTSVQEIVQSGRLGTVSPHDLRAVFETNVFGVVALIQAVLPLLREAPTARIVNLSSISASLSVGADPSNPFRDYMGVYSASKTSLNAVTLAFAAELDNTNIRINSVCPGFTATEMNNFSGPGTIEDAAREPVRLAALDEDIPTGSFLNAEGSIPW